MPAPAPLTPRQLAAHDDAVARGQQGYLDPTSGLFVMTAAALRARDRCCESGCRHCPYPPPEPRRAGPPPVTP